MQPITLFHVSEEPGIERFEPRTAVVRAELATADTVQGVERGFTRLRRGHASPLLPDNFEVSPPCSFANNPSRRGLERLVPSAEILHARRNRAFVWGHGQMATVTSIVATGAGLRVAATFIEHEGHVSPLATVLSVAMPVSVFLGLIYALYYYLVRRFEPSMSGC